MNNSDICELKGVTKKLSIPMHLLFGNWAYKEKLDF